MRGMRFYFLCSFDLDGMDTIVFGCFVESVVSVLLSVHCITTMGPLRYVNTSPFFGFRPDDLVAAGIFFLFTITVPVNVVPTRSSSVANWGLV